MEGLAALAQPPHWMDAIRVNCVVDGRPKARLALGFAAVGITGDLLRQTTRPVKRLFGQRLAYYIGLVRAIWSYRPARMRVACDASVWEERFLFVCAGNCERAGGGMRISPGARSDDGRLNVNLISSMERWETLRQLYLLRRGRHTTHPKVRYLTASSVAIDTDPAIAVAADGDLIGWTPARFGVQPKALKVFRAI
jgi:diacylglycerol kinase family enzyme